jgi:predicted protein tyrosine phosphatase
MVFIQNVSYDDIKKGTHFACGPNSMLIAITDPGMSYPEPAFNFKEVYRFKFKDEINEHVEGCISEGGAIALVRLLERALAEQMNVVVHCMAGLCRSVAVAEVGVIMGLGDTHRIRIPNVLVKTKMMRVLGLTYDSTDDRNKEVWH